MSNQRKHQKKQEMTSGRPIAVAAYTISNYNNQTRHELHSIINTVNERMQADHDDNPNMRVSLDGTIQEEL